jgi:hypothetical protein
MIKPNDGYREKQDVWEYTALVGNALILTASLVTVLKRLFSD